LKEQLPTPSPQYVKYSPQNPTHWEDLLEVKLKIAIFKQTLHILFFINKEKSDSIFKQNNVNFGLNPAFAMDF